MLKHIKEFWGLYFFLLLVLLIIFNLNFENKAESIKSIESNHVSKELSPLEPENENTMVNEELDPSWINPYMQTGKTPSGYNIKAKYDYKIDNYLEIVVGHNTDVVVKLINKQNEKCIRYIYVKSNDTYRIKNIPEGYYYLKIAYGKNWRQKEVNGEIIGKFLSNDLYEKGEDILDYNIIYGVKKITKEGESQEYSIPSYSIHLDVISSQSSNNFNTKNISEEEFNK